jgi:glycosyltransferase involved in cell wall biosynthesis
MLEPWSVLRQGIRKRFKKWLYWHLGERAVFAGAERILLTTRREMYLTQQMFNLHTAMCLVVPYGVPSPVNDLSRIPERLARFKNRPFALFLGRVHPHKNVHLLIEWWLASDMPELWDLVIAGPYDPSYKRVLDRIIQKKRRASQIHFVGFVDGEEKTFLLSLARWFLLPSEHENFGMAALEAMQHGCPVAISDQVYLSEFMHTEGIILPLTPSAWKQFFESTMHDSIQRERIRALDREMVLAKFEMQAVAQAWSETLYSSFGRSLPAVANH